MKKKHLLTCILLVCCLTAFGQTTGPNGYLPNYDPPSPEASALGKYVDHQVGLSTGTASVDLPLFEISCGRIKVPISIDYQATGVLVNEVASRVGMGWALSAGGVVTRTVKGFPDDTGAVVSAGQQEVPYFDNTHYNTATVATTSTMISVDLEPDEHFFNFCGKTGEIYFPTRTNPVLAEDEPYLVTGPYGGSNTFVITDEQGLVYTFANVETTGNVVSNGISYSCNTAWYLTNIFDPVTTKTVSFQYVSGMPALTYSVQKSYQGTPSCAAGGGVGTDQVTVYNSQVLSRITYDDGYIDFQSKLSREDLTGDKAYTQISEYSTSSGTAQLVKAYHFGYNYTSNGTSQENYRLYLDTLQEIGSDGSTLPPYLFAYQNRASVPQRQSPQQDIWGYYNANGATTNNEAPTVYIHNDYTQTDYLPFDNPNSPAPTKVVGIDRTCNVSTVTDGSLTQVTYPTKGYTKYIYEANQFDVYTGGGIRVKEIDDYSSAGQLLLSKTYQYQGGYLGGPYPQVAYPTNGGGLIQFWQDQSVLGSTNGSFVGYGTVTVTENSSSGQNNGNIVYTYTTTADIPGTFIVNNNSCSYLSNLSTIQEQTYFPFFEMQSCSQRRGLPIQETYTDASGNIRKSVYYSYSLVSHLLMGVTSNYILFNTATPPSSVVSLSQTRPINIEKMVLTQKVINEYDGVTTDIHSPSISKTTGYTYCGGTHGDQFTQTETLFSSGMVSNSQTQLPSDKSTQVTYRYPFDFSSTASGGVMGTMVSMNYISPVINEISAMSKGLSTTSPVTYYTDAKLTNYMHNPYYASGTNPNAIVPAQVSQLDIPAPVQQQSGGRTMNPTVDVADPSVPGSLYDQRLQYLSYDGMANPTMLQNDQLYQEMNWSPYSQLLLEISTTSQVMNTWTTLPPSWSATADPNAHSGGVDYTWNGTRTAFPFTVSGTQPTVVSFWAKGGPIEVQAVGGGTAGTITFSQMAGSAWQYYTVTLQTVGSGWAGAPIYLTGTATIDDVFITNDTGQKTFFYYDASNRLQSVMDPGGKIRIFQYDPFSRMINTLDENGNILKHIDYHYNGQ